MSDKRRLTQHRQQRDGIRTKEVADLKRENHQLRRRVSRLEKLEQQTGDAALDLIDPEPMALDEDGDQKRCPNCDSTNLGTFVTPSGSSRLACKSCKKYKEAI